MKTSSAFLALVLVGLSGDHVLGQPKLPDRVKQAADKAEKVELISLDPDQDEKKDAKDAFYGWKVLGRTEVKGLERDKLLAALEKGVRESKGMGARCFIPRHGVRFFNGKEELDLVICFQCSWIHIRSGEMREVITVAPGVQATLDEILKEAKVPLPRPAK